MLRRRIASILVLVGIHLASPLASAEVSSAPLARWAGAFDYAGDAHERDALERAIDRATAEMGPLARHVARNRLEREMRPDPRIVVRIEGSIVGIGAQGEWETVLDGPARVFDDDGDRYRVMYRTAGPGIVQVIEGDALRIYKTYALSADGTRMRVAVTFVHDRLPAPLRFVLSYRRAR
jgi:hypothetical protein